MCLCLCPAQRLVLCSSWRSCSLLCSTVLLDVVISSAHGQITVCSIMCRGEPGIEGWKRRERTDLPLHKEDYLLLMYPSGLLIYLDVCPVCLCKIQSQTSKISHLWCIFLISLELLQMTKHYCNNIMIRNYLSITFIVVDFPLWLMVQNHRACYSQHEISTEKYIIILSKKNVEIWVFTPQPRSPSPSKRLLSISLSPVHCAQKWFPFLLN